MLVRKRNFKLTGDAEAKNNVVVEFPIGIKGPDKITESRREYAMLALDWRAGGSRDEDEPGAKSEHVYFRKIRAWVALIKAQTGHLGIRIDQFADSDRTALA